MKKTFIKQFFSLMLILLLSFVAISNHVYAAETKTVKSTISISGSYTVKVTPDIAYIDISVKTFHADAVKSQEDNRIKMNKVMEQLKKLEIEDNDIRTVDYRIQPRYEWKTVEFKNELGRVETKNEQVLLGYDVINSIKVTVHDLQKVGNVIDVTVKEGVNEANNIAFGLSETTKNQKYLEALKGAVENGKAKAESIAGIFGIKLNVPTSITESGAYFPPPIIYRGMEYAKVAAVAEYDASASTPISGGEMEIRANVNMIYEY